MRESAGPPLAPAYLEAFAAIDRDPNQLLIVGEDGEARVVGCAQVTFIAGLSRRGSSRRTRRTKLP